MGKSDRFAYALGRGRVRGRVRGRGRGRQKSYAHEIVKILNYPLRKLNYGSCKALRSKLVLKQLHSLHRKETAPAVLATRDRSRVMDAEPFVP